MTKFKIGDLVRIDGHDGVFVITGVDCFSSPIVKYKLDRSYENKYWVYEINLKRYVPYSEILDSGVNLVDESFYGIDASLAHLKNNMQWNEIKIMSYKENIYYIKMVNDEIVEFKEIRE